MDEQHVIEQNRALAHRYFRELGCEHRLELIDELFWPDHTVYDPLSPDYTGGVEQTRAFLTQLYSAFPDYHMDYTIEFVSEDGFCVSYKSRGTHQGQFGPFAPTQRTFTIDGVEIVKVRDGKIAAIKSYYDGFHLFQQLGFGPEAASEAPDADTPAETA